MRQLRIGILGAARIAENGIVGPARATGCRLVAIAARDSERAKAFAARFGVERVAASYHEVIDDPDIDLIYNPLANSLHAPWNLAAIAAGKHVLSEKPFARNAAEAAQVHEAGLRAGVVVADGFHYRYHPATLRLHELARRGVMGDLQQVEATVVIPRPEPWDFRLSLDLGGGALMDGGCYAMHAIGTLGDALGQRPRFAGATGREFADLPGVDEQVDVEFEFPSGARALGRCWMAGDRTELSVSVRGARGFARVENFILPHLDDRLTVEADGVRWVEHLGTVSSYTYQLQAVLRAIRHGDPLPTDSADAVRTMTLVDAAYRAVGLPLR